MFNILNYPDKYGEAECIWKWSTPAGTNLEMEPFSYQFGVKGVCCKDEDDLECYAEKDDICRDEIKIHLGKTQEPEILNGKGTRIETIDSSDEELTLQLMHETWEKTTGEFTSKDCTRDQACGYCSHINHCDFFEIVPRDGFCTTIHNLKRN